MPVIELSEHDLRIAQECRRLLPRQPHVAYYVATRLQEEGGSVLVARYLCELLAQVPRRSELSRARVELLWVDETPADLHQLVHGNTDPMKTRRLARLRRLLTEIAEDFERRDSRFSRPAAAVRRRVIERTAPNGTVRTEQSVDRFLAIFNCAQAMLYGAGVDVQGQVA